MHSKHPGFGPDSSRPTLVKICGLTRPEDTSCAVEYGADFVGVVFAGGPRTISPLLARGVLEPARGRALGVGVFGQPDVARISDYADLAGLHIAQIHGAPAGAPSARELQRVREQTGLRVWAVVRIVGAALPEHLPDLFEAADAVLVETYVPGRLGGTGKQLPWPELSGELRSLRPPGSTLVLAGGLNPGNVTQATTALAPDIVDVSSGVEREPGVKDHELIRTFIAAARGAQ